MKKKDMNTRLQSSRYVVTVLEFGGFKLVANLFTKIYSIIQTELNGTGLVNNTENKDVPSLYTLIELQL